MLQYIIDAYKEKNKEEGFFKSIKSMKKFHRIFLFLIIGEFVASLVCVILKMLNWCFYSIIAMGVTLLIHIFISTRARRKNWHKNIQEYNKTLDELKDILKERTINYYSENKIKILIYQCEQSINEIISNKEKFKEQINNFIEKFIIPIVAFFLGVSSNVLDSKQILALCIIAIIVIVMLNFCIKGFENIIEDAEGNLVEERRYMRSKLQDLLIRDFDVEKIS